jgi:hypothetical protein
MPNCIGWQEIAGNLKNNSRGGPPSYCSSLPQYLHHHFSLGEHYFLIILQRHQPTMRSSGVSNIIQNGIAFGQMLDPK